MSNEMDLHTSPHEPKSGLDRVLVYYYAALVFFTVLIVFRIENSTLRLAMFVAVLVLAVIPPIRAKRKKRKLQEIQMAQLAEHRKSKS